jgi:hypothetical protein
MPGTIELTGEASFPPCPCCGLPIRRVWGNLIDDEGTTAYVVQWSPGSKGTHSVMIGMIFGAWGDGTGPDDRAHVAVECRQNAGAIDIMVIDARRSPIDARALASKAMWRKDVINRPLQARVLGYVEQIRVRDVRVNGLVPG